MENRRYRTSLLKSATQTDLTHSCKHTLPCAAASRFKAVSDHTPGPPDVTNHPCKVCGKYLHGTCGVADLLGEGEMRRDAPRLPHIFKLPRPRDLRRGHYWRQVRGARLLGGQRQGPCGCKQWRETSPTCRQKTRRSSQTQAGVGNNT